jgi:hypothetical protein
LDDRKVQGPQVLPSRRLPLVQSNNIVSEAEVRLLTNQGSEHGLEHLTLDGFHLLSLQELPEQQVGGAQRRDFPRPLFEKLLDENPGDSFVEFEALDALVFRIHDKEGVISGEDGLSPLHNFTDFLVGAEFDTEIQFLDTFWQIFGALHQQSLQQRSQLFVSRGFEECVSIQKEPIHLGLKIDTTSRFGRCSARR